MLMVAPDLGKSVYLLFFDLSDWLMVKGPSAKNAFNKALFFVVSPGSISGQLQKVFPKFSHFFHLKLLEGDS